MTRPSPIEIIINAASGANDKDAIRRRLIKFFDAKDIETRISLARTGAELVEAAKTAARGRFQTIVAGGNGTLATVAAQIVGKDKTFGVLGKLNGNFLLP